MFSEGWRTRGKNKLRTVIEWKKEKASVFVVLTILRSNPFCFLFFPSSGYPTNPSIKGTRIEKRGASGTVVDILVMESRKILNEMTILSFK